MFIYVVSYRDMIFIVYFLMTFAVVGLVGFLYFENKSIVTTKHRLAFEFLPKEFDGFTIVHLSDLHNKLFGENQRHLVDAVQKAKPDIIVITGDIVDELFTSEEPALVLVRQLRDVAPIYYVSGNHEWESGQYEPLRDQLIALGVHVLDNRSETIERGDRLIAIAGIDDPARYQNEIVPNNGLLDTLRQYTGHKAHAMQRVIHRELDAVRQGIDERAFKILLVHRPEWLPEYMDYHFNLIFSGHAHGGQWNLPFIGPVLAPGQGMFPRLVSGIHKRHGTTMIVSRGLGNSGFAFQRLFNRPEVVVVTLRRN